MLANKLSEELEDEDMEAGMDDMAAGEDEMEAGMDDMEMGADEMDMDMPDSIGVGIDLDNDGEYDYEGDLPQAGEEEGMDDMDMGMDDMEAGMDDMAAGEDEMAAGEDEVLEDDLNLESIIAELEEGMYAEEEDMENEMYTMEADAGEKGDGMVDDMATESIDELIEAILAEESDEDAAEVKGEGKGEKCESCGKMHEGSCVSETEEIKEELEEAYRTVRHLKSVINEVNLLNAKLLYTNKLFRNFELNESQKMKVIENFDRAATTREAKLVFSTLAESFKKPTIGKKKVVKESKSYASRPVKTTAPSKQTTQVLNEGFEHANRWKKLAGLL